MPDEKRNKIIDCAVEEFSQRDFDNAKLSNIVKNADIARGSIYQYFEDKMDLYLYVSFGREFIVLHKNPYEVLIKELAHDPIIRESTWTWPLRWRRSSAAKARSQQPFR